MIADAIEKVGNDGALSVQDGQTTGIELELTDGMRLERGWLSQEMVTDEARTEAVLDYPFILLADQKLASGERLMPVLEQVAETGRPLLVIAEMIEGDALQTLVTNKRRGCSRRSRSSPRSSASGASGCSKTLRSSPAASP